MSCEDDGRDTHSLRHSYRSSLDAAGTPVAAQQMLDTTVGFSKIEPLTRLTIFPRFEVLKVRTRERRRTSEQFSDLNWRLVMRMRRDNLTGR